MVRYFDLSRKHPCPELALLRAVGKPTLPARGPQRAPGSAGFGSNPGVNPRCFPERSPGRCGAAASKTGHQSWRRRWRFPPPAFSLPPACPCADSQFSWLSEIPACVLLLKSEEGKLVKHPAPPHSLSCTRLPFLACCGPGWAAGRT